MPLTPTDKIDIIMKRVGAEGYDLIVIDDGSERDEIARYNWLLAKCVAYLTFVSSGQFVASCPEAAGLDVRVLVLWRRPPNEAMTQVEAVKDRHDPNIKIDVVFMSEKELLKSGAAQSQSRPWWKFW